jgi:Protein of unknown function (DUF3891)
MFRSTRRPVVFPQAEHARLAAAIALEWAERPAIPWEPFVAGVALHDRGYGQLDADDIDDVAEERWIEIQRKGFAPRGADPVVDLIAALHVRRLVSHGRHPAVLAEMDAQLPALREAAGLDEETAAAADRVTALCDRLAFVFCFEEPASGELHGIGYELDGLGEIVLDPWPLGVPELRGLILAYEGDGYPERAEPVVVPFRTRPRT